jgi:site-specific DNA-cytosine methylase
VQKDFEAFIGQEHTTNSKEAYGITWPCRLHHLGWECQGFSAAGFGEGLSDTRSGLFMDMIRLITWAQSMSPTLGYVIENTPSQLDQREKVQEHYTLVKHYLEEPLLLDAA